MSSQSRAQLRSQLRHDILFCFTSPAHPGNERGRSRAVFCRETHLRCLLYKVPLVPGEAGTLALGVFSMVARGAHDLSESRVRA